MSAISQFSLVDVYARSAFVIVVINLAIAFVFQGLWCFSGQHVRRLFAHPKWYNFLLASLLVLSVAWTYLR
ncbi:MAG: hypothetical protein OXU94_01365 [Gammaproteobacteria bacterium]|nr:hypothetical protein [Gammaproteobacteria bacterium]